ncbi:ThuA domain-containing protein [Kitasatospora nipponensis]|uniref:ThuA domain-containing protein n=1 Tax=Kitasatospora nipponensis TaxID=258049 RepID=A0ABP4GNE4_9ACTN
MVSDQLARAGRGRQALVVCGGWEGHRPAAAGDRCARILTEAGYRVTVSDSLDSYTDEPLLRATDLVVQCWTMGRISPEQLAGLSRAVRAGTGLAGWHGGIVDAFREEPAYQLMTGGQFVHHPREPVAYTVRPCPGRADHPVLAGVGPFPVTTEQYYVHVDPGVDVLAHSEFALDPDHPELAGTLVPVTWTRAWGAGRVFVTTIGHTLADLAVPEVDAMIRQGMAWVTR